MLKTKVKASKITNLTDARYFSAWEVAYIGFNLEHGNDTYIEPVKVKAMKEWLEGPEFIGEFGSFIQVDEVVALVEALDLNGVQVGTLCDLPSIQTLHEKEIPIIKEIVWNENSNWDDIKKKYETISPYVQAFLLDFSVNQISIENDLARLKEIVKIHPTLIDTSFNHISIDTFLDELEPYGLAVKGGEEEKVGYKSFDEVDEIFEALEIFI